MNKMNKLAVAFLSVSIMTACTTVPTNSIREAADVQSVKGCKPLGDIAGSDAIFVGLSASVGSKNAYAKAMTEAVQLNATDVLWSQKGTSMTNEWIGKAYACK